jgi:hypothetical protein
MTLLDSSSMAVDPPPRLRQHDTRIFEVAP